jgi:hypothetical protein
LNKTSLSSVKRDGTVVFQEQSFPELNSISEPMHSNLAFYEGLEDYAYLSDAGEGATVYVFDSGVTLSHPVSSRHAFYVLLQKSRIS